MYIVKINSSSGLAENEVRFGGKDYAAGFASGMAYALAASGMRIETTSVPSLDGYKWWLHKGSTIIEVVDENGNLIKD